MNIPLIKPFITEEVKNKVCEVLDSGYLTEGPVTAEFETSIKEYVGCDYAIAVTSCTTGLEMALRALNIGPGDEVIVPDYTYPATASVVNIVGADIVIVDVSQETMLIDYDAIENAITDKTKAIIPVSLFGNPLDYSKLNDIRSKYDLYVIEDAACSLGAEYNDTKVGKFADISVFSLHPRKFITTGEGGIITTNNKQLYEWMVSYKHFGMGKSTERHAVEFDIIGTNYKLSNILAAVGLVQMNYINELLSKRRELAKNYTELLMSTNSIAIPSVTSNGLHSYQSYCVHVSNRDEIMKQMRKEGIEVQIGTYSLHMHRAYDKNKKCRFVGCMEGSRYCFMNCLTLPLFNDLPYESQHLIVNKLRTII